MIPSGSPDGFLSHVHKDRYLSLLSSEATLSVEGRFLSPFTNTLLARCLQLLQPRLPLWPFRSYWKAMLSCLSSDACMRIRVPQLVLTVVADFLQVT